MKFVDLLMLTADLPLFETGVLLAGDQDPADIRRQLSRWVRAGKILQLRRGLYTLAPPYQKVLPHLFLIANHLVRGSYVSLQSSLAYYGMIPEYVPVTLSMTTRSPVSWENALGYFQFHHITGDLFTGYQVVEVSAGQEVFLATPEKAILDLVHLTPGGDARPYLESLRLQNLAKVDETNLRRLAGDRPKLNRAAARILQLVRDELDIYETL